MFKKGTKKSSRNERLAKIWNQNSGDSTLSKFDCGYDALRQITNWTQQADSTTTNVRVMQYDPVNHGNLRHPTG